MNIQPYRRRHHDEGQVSALALGAGLLAVGAVAFWTTRQWSMRHHRGVRDSAPGRTSRRTYHNGHAVVGRSVTINRPRSELYAFWRDFTNLARVMENVRSVEIEGDLATWTIRAPAGRSVEVKTRIVSEKENEQIAWRSVEGSDVETEGKVMFRHAPGGRGTVVEAVIAYRPPAGEAGRLIAKLFQAEPEVQARRDLKRFKMLMETGEVTTSRNQKTD